MSRSEKQQKDSAEKTVREIRRRARRRHSSEEKIRIIVEGLRGEDSIAGAVSQGRGQSEPVLALVESVSGSRQKAPGR